MLKLRLTLLMLIFSMVASACAASAFAAAEPPACAEISVAAASDLQFAFNELASEYTNQTGCGVRLVFGSTGQLVQQIENGAPYDLIAAANIDYIQRLSEQGLVLPESIRFYAQGRIVLAVNQETGLTVDTLDDLLSPRIRNIAIANPAHAPYGVAAMQALQAAGLWEQLQPKLVLGENVRQALQFVQTGDAEAGIIALSVAEVPEIYAALIDDALHAPLNQAFAVTASSQHPDAALQFGQFINGEYGRAVMRKYGFILPAETAAALAAPLH